MNKNDLIADLKKSLVTFFCRRPNLKKKNDLIAGEHCKRFKFYFNLYNFRLVLPFVCFWCLYKVLQTVTKRRIDEHLHYICALWGIACGAGTFRGTTLIIGWYFRCTQYVANPLMGIFFGPMISTLLPMIIYVYWVDSWDKPYLLIVLI